MKTNTDKYMTLILEKHQFIKDYLAYLYQNEKDPKTKENLFNEWKFIKFGEYVDIDKCNNFYYDNMTYELKKFIVEVHDIIKQRKQYLNKLNKLN